MTVQRPAKKPSSVPPESNEVSGISALRPALPPTRLTTFPPPSGERRRRRILLVEPDLAVAQLCQAMLGEWFDVAIESNPVAALDILSSGKITYDLVLCNTEIPMLSGFDFVRRMKAIPAAKTVPAVLFNGEETSADVIRAIQSGVRHYIPKTMSLGDLAKKITSLLPQRR
jgi:DNA-binding response OmpR family regulator